MWTFLGGKKNILKFCLFWYNVGYIYRKLNNMKNKTRLEKCADYCETYFSEPARVINETQMYISCETRGNALEAQKYLSQYGETEMQYGEDFYKVVLTLKTK
jgi:hypothetical protein